MNKTVVFDSAAPESPEEIAAIQAEIQKCMMEWEEIQQRMDARRRNIERLKHETRAMLVELQEKAGKR